MAEYVIDPQGRVLTDPVGAPVAWRGGIGFTAEGALCTTTTVSPIDVWLGGRRVSTEGRLVIGSGDVAARPYNFNAGIPSDSRSGRAGVVIAQANQTPAPTDPFVAGIRVGPLGGVYVVPVASGGVNDPDAEAWEVAVATNGGTVSANTLAAVNDFCVAAKANGYWDKLLRVNLLCGDDLNAALVPLKAVFGSAVDASTGFTGANYSEAVGLTGTSDGQLVGGGNAATDLELNNTHLMFYNRSPAGADGYHIYCGLAQLAQLAMHAPLSTNTLYSDQYDSNTGRVQGAVTLPYGFLCGSRTSATEHAIYQNGVLIANNATSGGALPEMPLHIFQVNGSMTGQICAAYSIGTGLTAAEVADFYADIQAFQTALGRQVGDSSGFSPGFNEGF